MTEFCLESDLLEIEDCLGATVREFAGKSVLITGASGFLGRYLLNTFAHLNRTSLSSSPVHITALDNLVVGGELHSKAHEETPFTDWIRHDVIQPFKTSKKIDFIFHAAGIASPYYYRKFPLETLDVAVMGTRNMLDLAMTTGARMLFFSSSEIYGDPLPEYVPTNEDYHGRVSCLGPRACYDESKRLGETLCRIYSQLGKAQAKIVRPFNVFGPGMRENDYRVLPNFASSLKAGKPLSIYGDGNQTRTFCYVTDAIYGFIRVIVDGEAGAPFNIGNPKPEISMLALADEIRALVSGRIEVRIIAHPESYPADEPQRRCPDIRRAQTEVGFEPRVSLQTGLRRYLDWALPRYTGHLL